MAKVDRWLGWYFAERRRRGSPGRACESAMRTGGLAEHESREVARVRFSRATLKLDALHMVERDVLAIVHLQLADVVVDLGTADERDLEAFVNWSEVARMLRLADGRTALRRYLEARARLASALKP